MNDRPSEARVASIYHEIFGPEWNVQKLAHSAIQGHLLQKVVHGPQGAEVVGRSIVWRLMLATDSPLNASTGLQELRRLRADYVRLLKDSMRAPDGTFPESLVVPGETDPPRRTSVNMNLAQNNPLSLDESNPWKDYFTSLELRKTIQKDVERTFPDVDYFRSPNAQRMLADILFVYSKANDVVSYRQGMHELLAPVLWALDYDSLEEKGQGQTDEMHEFLSRDYVPADAWAIFSRIMNGAGVWYEWREPAPTVGGPPSTPWVAPINEICNKIGGEYLRACDPALGARMSELGIEPQMYGIRWLRLLFTREFPWRDALILWDALFATDPSMELVPWVCVAMLIRIRNLLIPAEYTEALTYLLRYPPPPSVISSDPSDATPQPETLTPETHILVQQALMLRANPAPATGSTIVLQNRSALNIPIEAPSPPPPAPRRGGRRRSIGAGAGPGSDIKPNVGRAPRGRGISRHVPEGSLSGLAAFNSLGERADVLAKGLWDIGGTVGNRVSEMRKNLPDLVRTPSMAAGDSHAFPYYQVIPGSNDDLLEGQSSPRPSIVDTVRRSMEGLVRPSMERQSSADVLSVPAGVRSPRTRFEVEREVGEVKAVMRKLGEGIGIALEGLKDGRKDEAMESLEYIQMVLGGAIELGKVDEERVLGATEAAKRREAEGLSRAEQEKEIADAEEARVREEQERQRAQEEEEKQRKLEEERAREQDPLQASPVVRSAPLMQTSPPRIRTTRAPWERATGQVSVQSGYGPGKAPISGGRNTPPVQSGRRTPLAQSGESTPSMQSGQKPLPVQPVSSQHERPGEGGNDPLGAGLLG